MSNPTELPDLDKLEAYATSSKNGDWHATESMLNMLDEDDVLALVAAARRAQPEGEAPQAERGECEHCHTERPLHLLTCPVSVKGMAEGKKKEAPEPLRQLLIDFSNNTYFCGLHLNDDAKYAGYLKDAEVAEQAIIELFGSKASPLCGAQHAESGKEVAVPGWEQRINAVAPALRVKTKEQAMEAEIAGWRALAAQQAAVPGALDWVNDVVRDVAELPDRDSPPGREDMMLVTVNELHDIIERHAPSAPGTPEAPQPPFPVSDEEMAALRRFWECASDGEGYDVEKTMMQRLAEMGLVQRKSGAYYMTTDFGLYVLGEYTIDSAAQLDGGQGETA